jgi:putative colanic acid biosynthesis UDP-glucose lipid carrier transferase
MSEQYIPTQSRSLIKNPLTIAHWLQIVLDQVVIYSVLYILTYFKVGSFPDSYQLLAGVTSLTAALIYKANGVYLFRPSLFDRFLSLLRGWTTVLIILVVLGFVTKSSATYSREVMIDWFIIALFGQMGAYLFVNLMQSKAKSSVIPTLLIGARPLGHHLASHINSNKWIPDRIVGVIEDSDMLKQQWDMESVPVLGNIEDVHSVIKAYNIRRVYIALPMQQATLVKPLYLGLADTNVDVIWAPDIFGVSLLNHSIHEVAGIPLISLSETPMIGSSAFLKSISDVLVASTALILLSPVMLMTAALVKFTSPGPILFKQMRHGWDGKLIQVWKFRSMRVHEEGAVITQASKGDDRITPVGRFIRRSSIDELPQLFNVLAGTMSIVGPRPHAIQHNEFYSGRIRAYMSRHRVKPGLTGLAQVNGFRGETQTLESMADRVQYDLAYINNWSIWLDFKIMLRTVFVLTGKDVY